MKNVEVGQKLWWVDNAKRAEGTVKIVSMTETDICVEYEIGGKTGKVWRNKNTIGEKLFLEPQINKKLEEKSCLNCKFFKNESCAGVKSHACEDYIRLFVVPEEESKCWPSHMDWQISREDMDNREQSIRKGLNLKMYI